MTAIYYRKSCCWFYRSGSGTAQAGGCTKEFLDTHHGDVSLVMGPNGEPKQNATVNVVNDFSTESALLIAPGLDNGILPGLIGRIDNSFCEVTAVSQDTLTIDGWAGKSEDIFTFTNTINSIIYPYDSSIYSVGGYVHVKGTDDQIADGTYEILSIDSGGLQINDSTAVYSNSSGSLRCAPVSTDIDVVVGGAYNDMQELLDTTEAYYYNQWIFFNEDIAPAVTTSGSAYWIYSSHDGEISNNTKLYIVGYNTYAYDCLPAGYGYFPEGTQNVGTHYKTALERARNFSDTSIKTDLPTASTLNLPGISTHIFRMYTGAENIQFMGIYFETDRSCRPIIADSESNGSMFVKHCSGGHADYDANPGFLSGRCIWIHNSTTGGGIYDSFFKGVEFFNDTESTVDNTGGWEFAYNVGIHTGNITSKYSGCVVHHNIFVHGIFGLTVPSRSYQDVFSNIFYQCRRAAFNLNSTDSRLQAWNNIIVMDESDPLYEGLFRISTGGTIDFFDYNCYCNQNGQSVSAFISDVEINPSFNFDNLKKGFHDIEADPMFMDPDNFDFRLNPNSPCIGKGRPNITGTPTTIGPSSVKYTPCIHDKAIKFQRVYGWPVELPEGLNNGAYDD